MRKPLLFFFGALFIGLIVGAVRVMETPEAWQASARALKLALSSAPETDPSASGAPRGSVEEANTAERSAGPAQFLIGAIGEWGLLSLFGTSWFGAPVFLVYTFWIGYRLGVSAALLGLTWGAWGVPMWLLAILPFELLWSCAVFLLFWRSVELVRLLWVERRRPLAGTLGTALPGYVACAVAALILMVISVYAEHRYGTVLLGISKRWVHF
ncbi:MAG: hypothetical protein IMW86_05615 [Hydrogenibacillus sp.]|nr:hypothetical protein [Hydrogenibacillus sp.]